MMNARCNFSTLQRKLKAKCSDDRIIYRPPGIPVEGEPRRAGSARRRSASTLYSSASCSTTKAVFCSTAGKTCIPLMVLEVPHAMAGFSERVFLKRLSDIGLEMPTYNEKKKKLELCDPTASLVCSRADVPCWEGSSIPVPFPATQLVPAADAESAEQVEVFLSTYNWEDGTDQFRAGLSKFSLGSLRSACARRTMDILGREHLAMDLLRECHS
ncbi:hypothetical protein PHYPSEUDO_013737 [Phytophthora pseudosyringae]|uniref:Uncharacterized protein n=1 Tax=Phytophthora pseudosyringae TaxID=221518 RepID=A0A8T1W1I4_9STRA|nr:hypothetical protein PHYPSEUDO_013737 [Phytophthora pseudosyringae]